MRRPPHQHGIERRRWQPLGPTETKQPAHQPAEQPEQQPGHQEHHRQRDQKAPNLRRDPSLTHPPEGVTGRARSRHADINDLIVMPSLAALRISAANSVSSPAASSSDHSPPASVITEPDGPGKARLLHPLGWNRSIALLAPLPGDGVTAQPRQLQLEQRQLLLQGQQREFMADRNANPLLAQRLLRFGHAMGRARGES